MPVENIVLTVLIEVLEDGFNADALILEWILIDRNLDVADVLGFVDWHSKEMTLAIEYIVGPKVCFQTL